MTNAEARFNNSLRPRKPEGSLGRTAQDVHLDFHTAPELCEGWSVECCFTSTETVGLLGTGAQDGHIDCHEEASGEKVVFWAWTYIIIYIGP